MQYLKPPEPGPSNSPDKPRFPASLKQAPDRRDPAIENAETGRPTRGSVHDLGERYRALFERSLDTVYIQDLRGGFIDANPAALALLGYSREELAGMNFRDLLDQDQIRLAATTLGQILAKGYQEAPIEWKLKTKSGGFVYVETMASLIYDKDQPYAIQGIGRDVTEKKALLAEEMLLREQLFESQKLETVSKLISGLTHEMNNILGGIMGYADMIGMNNEGADGPKDTRLAGHVDMLMSCCDRAKRLIQQLQGFARRGKYRNEPVDMHAAMKELVLLLSSSIDKRISVEQAYGAENPVVCGDRGQLEAVVLNIVVNACDAMPEGGKVSLRTSNVEFSAEEARKHGADFAPGRYLRIRIEDSGTGMDEATLKKAFDPFFTTKLKNKSPGLGLPSAYGIAKSHGGTVELHSAPGEGTTVCIYLPLSEKDVAVAKEKTAKAPVKQSLKVLIVEDEAMIADMLSEMLEFSGHSSDICHDGQEGAEFYRQHHAEIDLVILDMVMPVMNGPDCFRAIRKVNPDARIIISSGYAKDADVDALLKSGAAGFVNKPYSRKELMDVVAKAISASQ
jgi:PAS domain S-box-containing protein